jgi:Na+/H+ antiporter NhaD/arsenite permease-like protein
MEVTVNPLRSERDAFRALLIVGVALGAVIVVAVAWRPAAGAALLVLELIAATVLLYRVAAGPPRDRDSGEG